MDRTVSIARWRRALCAALLLAPIPLHAQEAADPPGATVPLAGEAARLHALGLDYLARFELAMHGAQLSSQRDASLIEKPRGSPGPGFSPGAIALVEGGLESKPREKLADALREQAYFLKPPPGDAHYRLAVATLGEARALAPESRLIRRNLFRAFLIREEWRELASESAAALRRDPGDVDAWLMRAIALHRQEQFELAATAMENALARMPDAARAPYRTPARLFTPKAFANRLQLPDSLTFAAFSPAEQQEWSRRFWDRADPRPATELNEAELEYHVRLAYADLRWGRGSLLRGYDSDMGDIHVRYGPPERIYGLAQRLIWIYTDNSVFFFGRGPNYLNSSVAFDERQFVENRILIEKPVYWGDMPLVRATRPMLARVARFRAGADSVDAVVTAAVPVRSLLGDVELAGQLPIDVYVGVRAPGDRTLGEERRRVSVSRDSLPVGINGTWVRRLGAGQHAVRLQADQADAGRTAIATVDVGVDSLVGFGISDLLLGTEPTASGTPARWRDVRFAPTVGVYPYSQALGLVWETYDLVPRDSAVEYTVTLEIERTFKRSLAGFTARIARNLMNVVTQDGSATGKVSITYAQTRAASPIVTDFVAINLAGSVTGPYRVVVTITDRVTGRSVSRRADFQLAEN